MAEQMEVALEAARSSVEAAPAQVSGTVRITTTDTVLHGLVAPALRSLHAVHPLLSYELHTGNELASLTRRDADIAVGQPSARRSIWSASTSGRSASRCMRPSEAARASSPMSRPARPTGSLRTTPYPNTLRWSGASATSRRRPRATASTASCRCWNWWRWGSASASCPCSWPRGARCRSPDRTARRVRDGAVAAHPSRIAPSAPGGRGLLAPGPNDEHAVVRTDALEFDQQLIEAIELGGKIFRLVGSGARRVEMRRWAARGRFTGAWSVAGSATHRAAVARRYSNPAPADRDSDAAAATPTLQTRPPADRFHPALPGARPLPRS